MFEICLARIVQGMSIHSTHTVNTTMIFDDELNSIQYDFYYKRLLI